MMHDAIAKIGGEYLAFDRLVNDKADALTNYIAAIHDVLIELE